MKLDLKMLRKEIKQLRLKGILLKLKLTQQMITLKTYISKNLTLRKKFSKRLIVWVKKITGNLYELKTIYLRDKAGSDAVTIKGIMR